MSLNFLKNLQFRPTTGRLVVPCAAEAVVQPAWTDLKATAATLAQVRNPVGAGLANCNILDITGVTRVRAYARLSKLAGMSFSTDARFAFFAGIGTLARTAGDLVTVSNISVLECLTQTDMTTALTASSGLACNIPASPSTSTMQWEGNYLFGPAIQFTNSSGRQSPYLEVNSFNFMLALPVVAAVGAAVSGETSELIITSAN